MELTDITTYSGPGNNVNKAATQDSPELQN